MYFFQLSNPALIKLSSPFLAKHNKPFLVQVLHVSIGTMVMISRKDIIQNFCNYRYLPDVEVRSRSDDRLAPASISFTDELVDAALSRLMY